jgi:hypothetical protein
MSDYARTIIITTSISVEQAAAVAATNDDIGVQAAVQVNGTQRWLT